MSRQWNSCSKWFSSWLNLSPTDTYRNITTRYTRLFSISFSQVVTLFTELDVKRIRSLCFTNTDRRKVLGRVSILNLHLWFKRSTFSWCDFSILGKLGHDWLKCLHAKIWANIWLLEGYDFACENPRCGITNQDIIFLYFPHTLQFARDVCLWISRWFRAVVWHALLNESSQLILNLSNCLSWNRRVASEGCLASSRVSIFCKLTLQVLRGDRILFEFYFSRLLCTLVKRIVRRSMILLQKLRIHS